MCQYWLCYRRGGWGGLRCCSRGVGSTVGGNAFSKVGETIGEVVYKVVR